MPDNSTGTAPATELPRVNKQISKRVEARYKDAYRVAGFVIGCGTAIKAAGLILGFIIAIIGADATSSRSAFQRSNDTAGTSVFWGVLVFCIFFAIGIWVSAQGQTLRASLDSAVNSSPFLDISGKARAMGVDENEETDEAEFIDEQRESLSKLGWPGGV